MPYLTRFARFGGPLVFLVAMLASSTAQASDFAVTPTQLYVDANTPSTELTVTNASTDYVTLSAAVYRWTQANGNSQVLTPSTDVLVFPAIFGLFPLQQQTLRVGVTAPASLLEQTFRVVVRELPAPQVRTTARGATIRVLTAFSIPIFLSPAVSKTALVLQGASLVNDRFSVTLNNQGTVHVQPTQVKIIAEDESGRPFWSSTQTAWYVLAGQSLPVSTVLPPTACKVARSFAVNVSAPGMDPVQGLFHPSGTCRT